ncbi:MAG: metal ABC transporter ATP-binding protein [Candidatus Giovannonibacteria bacterium]|nr:metal ABC transporter ATP-binding protein [Candidatus Giovannonibacteria bacterium]
MPILEVKKLSVRYGEQSILDDISFDLEKGDTLAIIGPNGSGKTTLLRAILGAISYEGEIIFTLQTRIGYVPQKIDLERDLPITVQEFLLLKSAQKKSSAYSPHQALEMVNLSANFLKKRLGELSAGELQRVLIAWAVIDRPSLLLFDEPTASVDVAGQETVYELLHRLHDKYDLTLILISHDLTVVYRYASKVLCLNREQVCYGAPSEVLTPKELEKLYGGGHKFYHHIHEKT